MDSGKFKYKHEKQIRAQKTKQKEVEIKNIRIGFTTGKHDLEMRTEQIKKFFEKGHKAKIDMVLRGREKSHRDLARKIFDDFLALAPEHAFDMEPKKTPQGFIAIIRKK
jgi:translation initiation factor IF-3